MPIYTESRTKLADRKVTWIEKYTDKTELLKRQYEDIIGPGSYFRFEGRDADTGDKYFAIIGPARVKQPKPVWYCGLRKLPADYPTGGKYFYTLRNAAEYARDTWGIQVPRDLKYYDASIMKGMKKKMDEWKSDHAGDGHGAYASFNISFTKTAKEVLDSVEGGLSAEAMAERLVKRHGYVWFDLDDIMTGSDTTFNEMAQREEDLQRAKQVAIDERAKRRTTIANMYGPEYMEADFYHIWLVHRPDEGTYLISVGPYCGSDFMQEDKAQDKFGVFLWKLNVTTQEEIDAKVESLMQEYADTWGIELNRSDINIPDRNDLDRPWNSYKGEITINSNGREKVYNSDVWKQEILDYYGVRPGRGMNKNLREAWKERKKSWKEQLEAAYAESQETGKAFEDNIPPPPSIDLAKRTYGQLRPTTIDRENTPIGTGGTEEKSELYGFSSMSEAIGKLSSTVMQGAPIGSVPEVTSEDLREARQKNNVRKEQDRANGIAPSTPRLNIKPRRTKRLSLEEEKKLLDLAKQKKLDDEKQNKLDEKEFSLPENGISVPDVEYNPDYDDDDASTLASIRSTLQNLIRLAESFDRKGMVKEAEEVHRMLRKHIPPAKGTLC